ncbi:hypothetical protein [Melittangium boletus]|uniref:hypothetical protein n=1 Tax=Melittangium boletus TaxID=83453 RepID=UPI003DA2597E
MSPASSPLLQNRLEVHDRKQFELKLEYQPSGSDAETRYLVETYVFLPASLNIDAETYPRANFYADIHNYVRFKTPVMSLEELQFSDGSPLVRLEKALRAGSESEAALIHQAKLLSCVFRGVLRRFARDVESRCEDGHVSSNCAAMEREAVATREGVRRILERFRIWAREVQRRRLQDKTCASIRLVDEYLSLTVEQFLRKAVADMAALPRAGLSFELRKELMDEVLREEQYRRAHALRSVISPTGDNEEYLHRFGFLKKFCMNILFLSARRAQKRQGWEEVLFALAAGVAMTFASVVAFWAQVRFTEASLNFFLIMIGGYMMKDRIKEGMRRMFSQVAARHLYDRMARIVEPVSGKCLGVCEEKVDYGRAVRVPEELVALRFRDDLITASQGELSETVLRYQKQVVLDVKLLPRTERGVSGITDIIRINVGRFLRDMDEPEYALEYVDLEDFSVGRVRGTKSYQVDLAFRFTVQEAGEERVSLHLARLVLDRNGIKRMVRLYPEEQPPRPQPIRSAA